MYKRNKQVYNKECILKLKYSGSRFQQSHPKSLTEISARRLISAPLVSLTTSN